MRINTNVLTLNASRNPNDTDANETGLSNLEIASENLAAAERGIRDTDMAADIVNFTRDQVLLQAGAAMLAQATAAPQTILRLLE